MQEGLDTARGQRKHGIKVLRLGVLVVVGGPRVLRGAVSVCVHSHLALFGVSAW